MVSTLLVHPALLRHQPLYSVPAQSQALARASARAMWRVVAGKQHIEIHWATPVRLFMIRIGTSSNQCTSIMALYFVASTATGLTMF